MSIQKPRKQIYKKQNEWEHAILIEETEIMTTPMTNDMDPI
jgi:hypothetical protein